MFKNSVGVTQDEMRVFELYLKLSKQRNVNAQYNLGLMFSNGNRMKQDYDNTIKFIQLAILNGCKYA
jgi:uncharacterized protein